MKIFVKLFIVFLFLISSVNATEILVLPVDLLQTKENYYGFDEVSMIVANDIINEFAQTNGKIHALNLYDVNAKFAQNPQLKQTAKEALDKYKSANGIDYTAFKTVGENFSTNYILLVNGVTVTNKNSLRRSVWEVLELSTEFNIVYPYRLETSVVLLDTANSLVMWSNNFSSKLGSNGNTFSAKNYAQANAEYEKIKLYSKTLVAPATSQNIVLRFYPKAVRPIEQESTEPSGGALRFERTLPSRQHNSMPKDEFFGDTIFGI